MVQSKSRPDIVQDVHGTPVRRSPVRSHDWGPAGTEQNITAMQNARQEDEQSSSSILSDVPTPEPKLKLLVIHPDSKFALLIQLLSMVSEG